MATGSIQWIEENPDPARAHLETGYSSLQWVSLIWVRLDILLALQWVNPSWGRPDVMGESIIWGEAGYNG